MGTERPKSSGHYIEQAEVSLKAAVKARESANNSEYAASRHRSADDHYQRAAVFSNLAVAAALREANRG